MTHSLRTDAQTGGRAQLLQIIQTQFFAGKESRAPARLMGAEKNRFLEIVEHAHLSEHSCRHGTGGPKADSKSIGTCGLVNIVCGFLAARTVHILGNNVRLSRNIFLQKGNKSFDSISSQSAGRLSDNRSNRFALVKLSLREGVIDD